MMIDRRKFLGGVHAAGVVAVGSSVVATRANPASPDGSSSQLQRQGGGQGPIGRRLASAELSWLAAAMTGTAYRRPG
jgi:hypothetical protein